MATTQTAIRKMRSICLALPDTVESSHYGLSSFKVGKQMFATCGEKDGVCQIVFQLEGEHARQLLAADSRFKSYPRARDCLWINAVDVKDWEEVRACILESYRLKVDARATKRKRTSAARKRTPRKKNEA